jgi:hypothetical protein
MYSGKNPENKPEATTLMVQQYDSLLVRSEASFIVILSISLSVSSTKVSLIICTNLTKLSDL